MGLKSALVGALMALVVVGLATAATRPAVLKFATVVHDSKPVGSDEPYWDVTKVGEVRGWIIPDAATMTYEYFFFPTADQKKFDALNWNTHFVFFAALKQRTSGYDLAIRRVVLQRISRRARQLCIVAAVQKPAAGKPVVVRPWFSAHAVAMSSARFHVAGYRYAFPTRWVMRGTNGDVLAVSRAGGAYDEAVPTGKAKLCTLRSRASDEALG